MNRLNGAKCLVYSKDGIYKGMYICVIQIEENQEIGVLMNNSLGNMKKVTILVKDIKESLDLKPNQTFLVNKYKMQAGYFKTSEIRTILKELSNLDYKYKIGLIDLEIGFESILCAYC